MKVSISLEGVRGWDSGIYLLVSFYWTEIFSELLLHI